jgi:hypothetical protein
VNLVLQEINLLLFKRIAGSLPFQIQPLIFWNARISKEIGFYARIAEDFFPVLHGAGYSSVEHR